MLTCCYVAGDDLTEQLTWSFSGKWYSTLTYTTKSTGEILCSLVSRWSFVWRWRLAAALTFQNVITKYVWPAKAVKDDIKDDKLLHSVKRCRTSWMRMVIVGRHEGDTWQTICDVIMMFCMLRDIMRCRLHDLAHTNLLNISIISVLSYNAVKAERKKMRNSHHRIQRFTNVRGRLIR